MLQEYTKILHVKGDISELSSLTVCIYISKMESCSNTRVSKCYLIKI